MKGSWQKLARKWNILSLNLAGDVEQSRWTALKRSTDEGKLPFVFKINYWIIDFELSRFSSLKLLSTFI